MSFVPHVLSARTGLALAMLPALAAQQAPAAKPERFVLEAGEHELTKVVAAAGKFLGRNYLLAPGEIGVGAKVTLQTRAEVDAAGCESLLGNLAYSCSLVATPLDRSLGLWEFVNVNGARRAEAVTRAITVTPAELESMRSLRLYVTTRIELRHVRAGVMAQTLRPFFAIGGATSFDIGTAGNDGILLLRGMAADVATATELVADADRPAPLPKVAEDRIASLEARVRALEARVRELAGAATDKDKAPEAGAEKKR